MAPSHDHHASGPSQDQKEGKAAQWTHVSRKRARISSRTASGILKAMSDSPPIDQRPAADLLSVDDIEKNHDRYASKWRQSKSYDILCDLLKDNAASHVKITRAVCLGIGAFDPVTGSVVLQRQSHIQLEAFLAMVQSLGGENSIECIYQEPTFTQPEKDFIVSLGGTVVESPDGYKFIDGSTLVFGVHLYQPVWEAALEKSLPGLFVGTSLATWEEGPALLPPASLERIRQMDVAFDILPFPQYDNYCFSSTCIYWEKRDAENIRSGEGKEATGELTVECETMGDESFGVDKPDSGETSRLMDKSMTEGESTDEINSRLQDLTIADASLAENKPTTEKRHETNDRPKHESG